MEPRKDDSKQPSEAQNQAKKPRFQIVKLEERIAPRRGDFGAPGQCKKHPEWNC